MGEKPEFEIVVDEQLRLIGKTKEEMFAFVGVARSTLYAWCKNKEWCPYNFERVCEFLELPFRDKATALDLYKIKFRPDRQRPPQEPRGLYESLESFGPAPLTPETADRKLAALFGNLGAGGFAVFTSRTVSPAAFHPARYPLFVESLHRAMDAGALVGFLMPTEWHFHQLREEYGFDNLHGHAKLREEFGAYRDRYAERLAAAGAPDPEALAARRTQRVESDSFPMTPCGRIVTLIGEAHPNGHVVLRTLERGPGQDNNVYLMPENRTNDERLRKSVAVATRRHAATHPGGSLAEFAAALISRINGEGT